MRQTSAVQLQVQRRDLQDSKTNWATGIRLCAGRIRREELEFRDSDGNEFEPEYNWLMSFDTKIFAYDVFVTAIVLRAIIISDLFKPSVDRPTDRPTDRPWWDF